MNTVINIDGVTFTYDDLLEVWTKLFSNGEVEYTDDEEARIEMAEQALCYAELFEII